MDFGIEYIKRKKNCLPDFLIREYLQEKNLKTIKMSEQMKPMSAVDYVKNQSHMQGNK